MDVYLSRLEEMNAARGGYSFQQAQLDDQVCLAGQKTDNLLELTYTDRKRIHNLKYFTWIEQQGKTYEEIQTQWYEKDYWTNFQEQIPEIDELINDFNDKVGLI